MKVIFDVFVCQCIKNAKDIRTSRSSYRCGGFLADYKDNKLDRICLLCTEKTADTCHRRLAAEYIASHIPDVEITNL